MGRDSAIFNFSRVLFICQQQIFHKAHFLWLKSTDLDMIFSLAPKSAC